MVFNLLHRLGQPQTETSQTGRNGKFQDGWYPNDDFGLTLEPGIAASFWKIGQEKQHTVIPTMNASASWSPSKKVYLRGRLGLYMRPASPSESNPVLLQNSELMWSLGNPNLKNLTSWDTYIYSSYLATKWLSLSYGLGYVKTKNEIITTYRPASFEQGGLVKELVNPLHSEDRVMANISIDGSFFNDNLSVSISPEWSFVHVQGARYDKFHHVTFSGSIDYKLKDVEMGISYKGPYKDVDESGMRKTWRQGAWGASITYATETCIFRFKPRTSLASGTSVGNSLPRLTIRRVRLPRKRACLYSKPYLYLWLWQKGGSFD